MVQYTTISPPTHSATAVVRSSFLPLVEKKERESHIAIIEEDYQGLKYDVRRTKEVVHA
jgi:hypothetical protein